MDEQTLTTKSAPNGTAMTLNELAFKMGLDADDGGARSPRRPGRPYEQVEWVWICVNRILDACSAIPLMLSTDNDQIVESGPIIDALYNNPVQSLDTFLSRTIGNLVLYKEAYWVYAEKSGLSPTMILAFGPDQIIPVVLRGVVVGYELRRPDGTRQPLLLEDVHPLIGFNPVSDFRGVGPLASGRLAISSNYQATLFNEASLANGGRLGTILSLPAGVKLDEDEKAFLIAQFNARHGGAANAGKAFLASGGIEVKSFSQTMADLQMIDLRKFDSSVICALFGVPPELVGLNSEAQYAHGPAAQRFVTDTLSPLLAFIAGHLNSGPLALHRYKQHYLKTTDYATSRFAAGRLGLRQRAAYRTARCKAVAAGQKVFAWFAAEDHPALQQMLRERAEKMMVFVEKGVPLNQVIDAGDLPFEHVPWGDHHFVSAGMMPAQWILDGGMDAVLGPSLPEPPDDEPEKSFNHEEHEAYEEDRRQKTEDREKSNRIWRKYIASWQPLEKEFLSAMRTYFRRQKGDLVAKLESALKSVTSVSSVAKKDADGVFVISRVVIDIRKENDKLKAIHRTFFTRAAALGAGQTASDLAGQTGSVLKETLEQVLRRQTLQRTLLISAQKIQNVNATTARRVADTLRDGLTGGEGLPDLRKRLETDFSFSTDRAKRIARTHTGSAVSAGRHEAAAHLGAELKFWLTSKDKVVRQSHQQAEITHKDGIPLNEAFVVGGDFLLYPGDPGGSPANVINCRCMELIQKLGGKSFDLDFYDRSPMTGYTAIKSLLNEAQNV